MTQSYSLDLRVRVVAFVEAVTLAGPRRATLGSATASPSSWFSARRRPDRPLRRDRAVHPDAGGFRPMRRF
jgi:hypothetical protein